MRAPASASKTGSGPAEFLWCSRFVAIFGTAPPGLTVRALGAPRGCAFLEGMRGTGRGRSFCREGKYVAALALTDHQLAEIKSMAHQLPRDQRRRYLQRIAELLVRRDFGDGDVHRAARVAASEIMTGGDASHALMTIVTPISTAD